MAIKQSRGVTTGKGIPQRNEGQNGDITIRSSRRGLKMYIKQANTWHSVDLDINLRQIANTLENLERKVKELSTRRNNFPVVDKVMLKQADGTAAVQIKNDAGKIAFRNSADSADITLKNPKIFGAQDGSDSNPVIDTTASNSIKAVYNDSSDHFELRLVSGSGSAHRNRLGFFSGATHNWSIGHLGDDADTFKIAASNDMTTNVELTLTDAGALTVAGTVTSSAGVCQGTSVATSIVAGDGIDVSSATGDVTVTAETASDSNPGAVELATTAETTTGTDSGRAVTPAGLAGSTLPCAGATVTGATLTASAADDKLIDVTQTLNAGILENNVMIGENYTMIKTNLTDTASSGWDNVYLIDQQVGGASKFNVKKDGSATFGGTVTANNVLLGRFQVQGQYEVYGRYGSVNTWYTGNQNFGTSVTEGDWSGGSKYNYAQFTAVSNVKLIGWKFHGAFSSAVDWEMELWHTETPADGESDPEEATKVGDTQSVSPTASRLYTLGQTGLTYSVPAGDQLYLLTRYTSGSSTKYSYGTVSFEFSY
tara:strand:- start:7790 stop:9409 length:1620 start_codon:yes stop_codon:yes gene_type:complete